MNTNSKITEYIINKSFDFVKDIKTNSRYGVLSIEFINLISNTFNNIDTFCERHNINDKSDKTALINHISQMLKENNNPK